MFNDRRRFRDLMDELDKLIEEMAKDVEKMIRNSFESGVKELPKPLIYGFTMKLGPSGEPIIKTFGDREAREGGWREPVIDQFVDEGRGELKLFAELPGVEKEDIQVESTEDQVTLSATRGERRYRAGIELKTPIDPANASAVYRNGVLEVTFKLKGKANKESKRIRID